MAEPRRRLLPHLASLLLKYSYIISMVCYAAGFVTVLLLPALAKSTYISENALMPGSANPVFGAREAADAIRMADEVQSLVLKHADGYIAVQEWAVKHMSALSADCYLQPFSPPEKPLSSMRFYSSPQHTGRLSQNGTMEGIPGVNIVGIVRAPQAEGNEAVVLVTPFRVEGMLSTGDRLALGFGMALFELWGNSNWLAKDVIWVLADSRYSAYTAVAAWLQEYHEPRFDLPKDWGFSDPSTQAWLYAGKKLDGETLLDFKRAGTIAAGLVLYVTSGDGGVADCIKVSAEGPNGQMPNLDLINVVNSLAVWRQGLHMRVDTFADMQESASLNYLGQFLEKIGQLAGKVRADWGFVLTASMYVEGLATLFASVKNQALGLPTGAHGAFRNYQIDAVSLEMMAGGDFGTVNEQIDLLTKFGRLIEGVMRSVNNLLEKFHQSFFLYLLSAPNKFISVGVYMIPLGLLLLTLPLGAAVLCSQSVKTAVASDSLNQTESDSTDLFSATPGKPSTEVVKAGEREPDNLVTAKTSVGSWQRAVVVVSVVQLWASLTAIFPPFVSQLVDSIMMNFSASSKAPPVMKFFTIPSLKMFMWATMAIVSLLTMVSFLPTPGKGDWIAVKALLLGVATIGLGVMSQIDFAVSLVGALVLVPMSLCACPLTNIWGKSADEHKGSKSIQFRLFLLLGTMVNIIGSPPVLLASAMYFIGDSSSWQASLSKFWEWTELLWCWGSALYPYILVVHLPCSILCIYILLS